MKSLNVVGNDEGWVGDETFEIRNNSVKQREFTYSMRKFRNE